MTYTIACPGCGHTWTVTGLVVQATGHYCRVCDGHTGQVRYAQPSNGQRCAV